MQAAKSAVKEFMSKDGKHDTNVHETVAPAVTNETVNQHRHENVTTAVDREVHQDHYHTTVQPVHDKKVLEEKHHHNLAPVEHKKFEHGNDDEVQRRLQTEQAKFKDQTVKGDTHHTHSVQPNVAGEHIHHHVHENIQPVVHRQTVEPHVVHTTVPIHETHHSSAKHHETSALPAMSMADFKKQGGSLSGREARHDHFEGEPRNGMGHEPHTGRSSDEFRRTGHVDQHGSSSHHHGVGGAAATGAAGAAAAGAAHHHNNRDGTSTTGSGLTGSTTGTSSSALPGNHNNTTGTGSGLTGSHHTGTTGSHTGRDAALGAGAGAVGSKMHGGDHTVRDAGLGAGTGAAASGLHGHHNNNTTGTTGTTGSGLTGSSTTGTGLTGSHHNTTGTTGTTGSGLTGSHHGTDGAIGSGGVPHSQAASHDVDTTAKKPSLLQRLNPMKDTDGDGKKGFMD